MNVGRPVLIAGRMKMRHIVPIILMLFCLQLLPALICTILAILILAYGFVSLRESPIPYSVILPLITIASLGFFVTLYDWAFSADAMKGLYYLTRPIIFISLGVYLSKSGVSLINLVYATLVVATVLSIYYIFSYALNPVSAEEGRYAIRGEIGTGYMIVPIALYIAMYIYGIKRNLLLVILLSAVFALCIYLSDSRSAMILFVTIFLARYISNPIYALGAIVLSVILFFTATPFILNFSDTTALTTLLDKLPRGLTELVSVERYTDRDVNAGWRGYETYRAFTFVWSHPFLYQIFGTGWASQVPIMWNIILDGQLFESIPKFHSGFSTLFVRAGYLGVVLFFMQIALCGYFFSSTKLKRGPEKEIQTLGLGISGALVVLTPLIGGFFNGGAPGQVLLTFFGYCVGRHLSFRRVARLSGRRSSLRAALKRRASRAIA